MPSSFFSKTSISSNCQRKTFFPSSCISLVNVNVSIYPIHSMHEFSLAAFLLDCFALGSIRQAIQCYREKFFGEKVISAQWNKHQRRNWRKRVLADAISVLHRSNDQVLFFNYSLCSVKRDQTNGSMKCCVYEQSITGSGSQSLEILLTIFRWNNSRYTESGKNGTLKLFIWLDGRDQLFSIFDVWNSNHLIAQKMVLKSKQNRVSEQFPVLEFWL